jgi:hypothetical protein
MSDETLPAERTEFLWSLTDVRVKTRANRIPSLVLLLLISSVGVFARSHCDVSSS